MPEPTQQPLPIGGERESRFNLREKFLRYFAVGGVAALSEWTLFAAMFFILHWHYLIAGTISFLCATLVNYLLGLRFVFIGGRHPRHAEVTLVYLISATGLVINLLVLHCLIQFTAMQPMLSKILATGTAFIWNFTARHRWVFH